MHTPTQSPTSLLILSRWPHLFSRENRDHRRKCWDPHQTSELSLSVPSLLLSSSKREGCPTSGLRSVLLSPLEATPYLHRNLLLNLFLLSTKMFSFVGDFPLALTCSRHSRLLLLLRAKLVKWIAGIYRLSFFALFHTLLSPFCLASAYTTPLTRLLLGSPVASTSWNQVEHFNPSFIWSLIHIWITHHSLLKTFSSMAPMTHAVGFLASS